MLPAPFVLGREDKSIQRTMIAEVIAMKENQEARK